MTTETKKRSMVRCCCRGCFPDGCCGFCKPPPQVQLQEAKVIHVKQAVGKTETPYGYVRFYSGVRTSEGSNTCPMLSVHLYRYTQHHVNVAQNNQTVTVDRKNRQQTHQGDQQGKKAEEARVEVDVLMIPLEDITRITYKSGLKKGIEADIKSHVEPKYELSENCCDRCYNCCCGAICTCCCKMYDRCCCCCHEQIKIAPLVTNTTILMDVETNRNTNYHEEDLPLPEVKKGCCTRFCNHFRCWCCRKKKLVKLTRKTHTETEEQAERLITMVIEYSKYSHLDSASNARLLSNQDQMAYYKAKFAPDTEVKFYLDNNTEIDKKNFEEKREQAETLCRTIMQLKGMRPHYPSEDELEKVLDQSHQRVFGLVFQEPVLQLSRDPAIRGIGGPPSTHTLAIQQERVTTSE